MYPGVCRWMFVRYINSLKGCNVTCFACVTVTVWRPSWSLIPIVYYFFGASALSDRWSIDCRYVRNLKLPRDFPSSNISIPSRWTFPGPTLDILAKPNLKCFLDRTRSIRSVVANWSSLVVHIALPSTTEVLWEGLSISWYILTWAARAR